MLKEMLQETELRRAERDLFSAPANAVRRDVHLEVGIRELLSGERGSNSAEDRTDPGNKLSRAERFCHIIVRTSVKSADPVAFLAAGGEHDDRRIRAGRAATQ